MSPPARRLEPLRLVASIVGALIAFAVLTVAFLVAPLAVLAVFALGFAAADRALRRTRDAPGRQRPPLA